MEAKTDQLEDVERVENDVHAICADAGLTPEQCNGIIEDKLTHLLPALQSALLSMKQVNYRLANGEISWRRLLDRAKAKVETAVAGLEA